MTDQIADLKRRREQLTAGQVDAFVATLQRLRQNNPEGYRRAAEQLRTALG
jgi:hypothetical protein